LIALPDVNVLLALSWAQHVHHDAAHDWFQSAATGGWATCLLTQSAFVRLSMNPKVVHAALDCATARDLLAKLIAHPQHRYVAVGPSLEDERFKPIASRVTGYRQMPDATLLFVARCHSLQLVTFDRSAAAISPWPEYIHVLPSPPPKTQSVK
jgi:uncharacterized protein